MAGMKTACGIILGKETREGSVDYRPGRDHKESCVFNGV